MDMERARYNMVEQQIRPWDVHDEAVLDALFKLRRENFVPEAYRKLALADLQLPIGHGEVMLEPKLEARILQLLDVEPGERVLEVGTGSGYLTALLARFAHHVYSVEIVPELAEAAAHRLQSRGIRNVTLEVGDAAQGWERHAPYDVIVLTGSLPALPESFQNSLKIGGRLFAVVGDAPAMRAERITRVAPDAFRREDLFETCIPPLRNAQQPARFVF
jgi:protein-L-isoaspartate(D-aspartate) O-methyltransferase